MLPEERYQANLTLFDHHSADLAQMAAAIRQMPLCNIVFSTDADGQLRGAVWEQSTETWVPLCSANPATDAEVNAEQLYNTQAKVFSLFGLGLGHVAVALATKLQPWQRLVIFELDPNVFKAAMYAVDMTPFATHRVEMLVGPDLHGVAETWWLSLDSYEKPHIAMPFSASYITQAKAKEYLSLIGFTGDLLRLHGVGLATWQQFGHLLGDCDLLNAPELLTLPGIEKLAGLWKDKPAICIAAGPSLEKNLGQLALSPLRDQCAVISVGTTYALCQALGLQPDIVTTIDFQRLNWTDQFQHIPLDPACSLVYLHSTSPETPRRWPGPRFVALNGSETTSWLAKHTDAKGSAAQVQTVAHLNLLVALTLGANPIILMGQDLAMPRASHHALGARAQDTAPDAAPEDAFIAGLDYAGQPTWSRHSFLSMKTVFERIIKEHPETTVLNCTEGGLPLVGARNLPLSEALAAVAPSGGSHTDLQATLAQTARDYQPCVKWESFWPEWKAIRQQVDDLAEWAARALKQGDVITMADSFEALHEAQQVLLVTETVFQAAAQAFSFYAVRAWEIVGTMAAPPPSLDAVQEGPARDKVNCERLLKIATAIQRVAPQLQRVLRLTEGRLKDAACEMVLNWSQWYRMVARQSYARALQALPLNVSYGYGTQVPQAVVHLFSHQQQYAAADALGSAFQLAPRRLARQRRRLQALHQEQQALRARYFTPPAPAPAPVSSDYVLYQQEE